MTFPKKTRTWDQATAADGDFFDDEFDRVYEFINSSHEEFEIDTGETIAVADVVKLVNGKIRKGNGGIDPRTTITTLFAFEIQKVIKLNANQMMALYVDTAGPFNLFAVIIDVTGGTITTGTAVLINEAIQGRQDLVRINDTTALIAFSENDQGSRGRVVRVTVSGTTISVDTEATFEALGIDIVVIGKTKTTAGGAVIAYRVTGSGLPRAVFVTSGATPTIGSSVTLSATESTPSLSICDNLDDSPTSDNVAIILSGDQGKILIVDSSAVIQKSILIPTTGALEFASSRCVHIKDDIVAVAYRDANDSNAVKFFTARVNNSLTPLSGLLKVDAASIEDFDADLISETRLALTTFDSPTTGTIYEIDLARPVLRVDNSSAVTVAASLVHTVTISSILGYHLFFESGNAKTLELDYSETIGIAKEAGTATEIKPVAVAGFSIIHSGLTVGQRFYSNAGILDADRTTGPLIGIALTTEFLLLLLRQKKFYNVNHGATNQITLNVAQPTNPLHIDSSAAGLFAALIENSNTGVVNALSVKGNSDAGSRLIAVSNSTAVVFEIRGDARALFRGGDLRNESNIPIIGTLDTGETLFAKILSGQFTAIGSAVTIAHNISNADTNTRILGILAFIDVSGGDNNFAGLDVSETVPSFVRYNNTNVIIARGATGSIRDTFALVIFR